jgi:hypothetical protein
MNTKVDEGKLISGKEALIALANGEEVELQATGDVNWYDSTQWTVGELLCFKGRLRLKPRTISINGIEVPAPFEPKNGEDFYYLDCTSDNYGGWAKTSWRNVESDSFKNNTVFGAWRTEEEIKQVISALRFVLNGGWHEH